jgi:DNA-binding XRE family transcriptional regulator
VIKPPTETFFNYKLLKKMRVERNLNRAEVFLATDILATTLYEIERGNYGPNVLTVHSLARFYQLDSLEVGELLCLDLVSPRELILFRAACRHDEKTPAQAIREFINYYIDKVKARR